MITIVLPISRRDFLRPIFNCLEQLDRPADTELIILLDGDADLAKAVDARLDLISYAGIRVGSFGDGPVPDRASRRFRISEIHNHIKDQIPDNCDYVFSIEDDTTYPPDTLTKMLGFFDYYEDCAFVEAVELGRHKSKYVGGWKADNIEDPIMISSVMPNFNADELELLAMKRPVMERIDAGGLYCALIKADLYKEHHFEPFDQQGENGLSCDVNFGLWLRRKGFSCFMDWSIQCDHIGDKGSVNMGNTMPIQIVFEKRKGRWTSRPVSRV